MKHVSERQIRGTGKDPLSAWHSLPDVQRPATRDKPVRIGGCTRGTLTTALGILCLFLAMPSLRAADAARPPSDADRVLTAMQAEAQFAGFAATLVAGYERHAAALPPSVAEDFVKNVRSAHAAEKLYPLFREEFDKILDPAGTEAVIAWLDSPAGRRSTAAEMSALAPDAAAAFQAYMPTLLALPEPRKALVRDYLEVTGAETQAATLVTIPLRVYAAALRRSVPETDRGSDAEYDRRTTEMETDAVRQYLALMPASTAFTFRELSDDDFRAMLDFYRSPAGKNLVRATWAGTGTALRAAAAELGTDTATLLRDYTAPPPPSPGQ
jgi:hypothetical protein